MAYYIVNTDWNARDDVITCDLWFFKKMAFAGDFAGNKWEHASLFKRLDIGDTLFMYHSKKDNRKHDKKAFVGIGDVLKSWDEKCYEGENRLLYNVDREIYEYRICVNWFADLRESPKDQYELNLFTTPRTWARIDEVKYPVQETVQKLRK